MATILTAEDVVRRIAAECAYLDERGGVGIRLEPAAAIVRQYGEAFRAPRRQRRPLRVIGSTHRVRLTWVQSLRCIPIGRQMRYIIRIPPMPEVKNPMGHAGEAQIGP